MPTIYLKDLVQRKKVNSLVVKKKTTMLKIIFQGST